MKLRFKNPRLQKKYKKYEQSDRRVTKLTIDIISATKFSDLGHGAHFLKGKLKDCFAMDLMGSKNSHRLICCPGDKTEQDQNGKWIFEAKTEVFVIKITDHYKK